MAVSGGLPAQRVAGARQRPPALLPAPANAQANSCRFRSVPAPARPSSKAVLGAQAPKGRNESEYVTAEERPQGLKIVRPPVWRRGRHADNEGKSTFNLHHEAVQARIAAESARFPSLPSPENSVFQTSYGAEAAQFKEVDPLATRASPSLSSTGGITRTVGQEYGSFATVSRRSGRSS